MLLLKYRSLKTDKRSITPPRNIKDMIGSHMSTYYFERLHYIIFNIVLGRVPDLRSSGDPRTLHAKVITLTVVQMRDGIYFY
jgi:hypothetical protein